MKLLLSVAALAVSLVFADGKPGFTQAPQCFPVFQRDVWLEVGFEVVETHVQPGASDPDMVVTWEAWFHPSLDVYGMTGRNETTICVFEEGSGKPPSILDKIKDTRSLGPQGTAL